MKILNIHPHLTLYGGAEILLANLTYNFIEIGHQTDILTLSLLDQNKDYFHKKINFIVPEKKSEYRLRSKNLFSAFGIIREIKLLRKVYSTVYNNYDFTIIHNFPATWISTVSDQKKIWMCNEPPMICNNDDPGALLKLGVAIGGLIDKIIVRKNIDALMASDQFNAERVRNIYSRTPVINNYGVEYERFVRKKETGIVERLNIQANEMVFLQVGIFSPQKNQEQSVKALKRVHQTGLPAKLLLVGENTNEYGKMVRQRIREDGIDQAIIMPGNLSQDEVCDLYHRADYVIFPTKSQGGWLSPFEAICSGAKIIVTREFTASTIVEKNKLGIVTDNFLEGVVAYAVRDSSPELLPKEMRQEWVNNLSWETFAKNFINIYKNLP